MEESKKKSDFFAIFIAFLRENRSKMFFYFELSLIFYSHYYGKEKKSWHSLIKTYDLFYKQKYESLWIRRI